MARLYVSATKLVNEQLRAIAAQSERAERTAKKQAKLLEAPEVAETIARHGVEAQVKQARQAAEKRAAKALDRRKRATELFSKLAREAEDAFPR